MKKCPIWEFSLKADAIGGFKRIASKYNMDLAVTKYNSEIAYTTG